MIWNDTLKAMNLSFMPTCIALFAKISLAETTKDKIQCACLILFLLVFIIVCTYILKNNEKNLEEEEFVDKYGYLV